ncbi:MAG: diaminopimelate epimerase [Hyphomicrobiales bacterium]|nr:diaminopimelate epimerase [Hyphomicrobiales bacterium]
MRTQTSPAPYLRMNGIGNAILVLDQRRLPAKVDAAMARALHARPSLAFDQLMVIEPPHHAETAAFVEIFNNDGSRSAACGNGTRCVAFALLRGQEATGISVETEAGVLECWREGVQRFRVDMGAPRFAWQDIPLRQPVPDTGSLRFEGFPELPAAAVLSMGNPHAVFFVDAALQARLPEWGAALEHYPMFPERANISFAVVEAPDRIRLRVWERGAGLTLACGSAACATIVAAARAGHSGRAASVHLPGGVLDMAWRAGDDHVLMAGAVELEHEGTLDLADFAAKTDA